MAQATTFEPKPRARVEVWARRSRALTAAAVGVEVIGALGLVAATLFVPWEWSSPLWQRVDFEGRAQQVVLAATLLGLLVAWSANRDGRRFAVRALTVLLALAALFAAWALLIGLDEGGRRAGAVVAIVAALLVCAGAVSWCLARLALPPSATAPPPVADQRAGSASTGPAEPAAARLPRLLAAFAGAATAVAVLASATAAAPWLVGTQAASVAPALVLTGPVPGLRAEPQWQVALPVSDRHRPALHATAGGLVVHEDHGLRALDPRTGEQRWHFRDEAYKPLRSVATGDGRTVVLAMRYVAAPPPPDAPRYREEVTDRHRLVGIDATTGELRWERYDDDLVNLMDYARAASQGDLLVIPRSWAAVRGAFGPSPGEPVGLLGIGGHDGLTRWRADESPGCGFAAFRLGGAEVTALEMCPAHRREEACRVVGLDPETGQHRWQWPGVDRIRPDQEYATRCRIDGGAGLVLVSYSLATYEDGWRGGFEPGIALRVEDGQESWEVQAAAADDDRLTFNEPVAAGEYVVDQVSDGSGGRVLLIRDRADGQQLARVPLPAGEVIDLRAVGEATALVLVRRSESGPLQLVEVDLAVGEVRAEAAVFPAPEHGVRVSAATVVVGPETVAVATLVYQRADGDPDANPGATAVVYGLA